MAGGDSRCRVVAFFPSSDEEGRRRQPAGWWGSLTTPALRATPPQERRGRRKKMLRAAPPQERRGRRPRSPRVDAVQVFDPDFARRDFAQRDDRRLVARGLDVRRAALGELARAVRGRERQLEAVGDSL